MSSSTGNRRRRRRSPSRSPLPPPSSDEVHEDISCNSCGVDPIVGVRFKCMECVDFDLCENCKVHSFTHYRIECNLCAEEVVGLRYKCLVCKDFDLCSSCIKTQGHDRLHPFKEIPASTFENPHPKQHTWLVFPSNLSDTEYDKHVAANRVVEGNLGVSGSPGTLTDFGCKMLQALTSCHSDPNRPVLFSPVALSLALTMAAVGAVGETRQQLEQLIGTTDCNFSDLNKELSQLKNFQDVDVLYQVLTSQVNGKYNEILKTKGLPEIMTIESSNVAASVQRWLKGEHFDLFEGLFHGELPYLVGAARWPRLTLSVSSKPRTMTFELYSSEEDGKQQMDVDMLLRKDNFLYYEDAYCQVAEIPCEGTEYVCTVFLPRISTQQTAFSCPEFSQVKPVVCKHADEFIANHFTANYVHNVTNHLRIMHGTLAIPSMALRCSHTMKEPLLTTGLVLPFAKGEFPLLSSAPLKKTTSRPLNISQVISCAALSVCQGQLVGPTLSDSDACFRMVCTHPFVLVVRNRKSGAWILAGKVRPAS